MKTETIAAIATAMSNSGIGIIRISGTEAMLVANQIFRSKGNKKTLFDYASHTIHYGFIYDGDELLDEVMIALMKAPKSYTMEDTIEINCHGGILIMNRILELVIRKGARIAEPGEFTKRAFLNGRIDLSKAEAIMDLIHSKNELALKNSVSQLKGSVSKEIKLLREAILFEIAFIESALDDPEHISLEGYCGRLEQKVDELLKRSYKLSSSYQNGRLVKEGINTVIVGKPNAGKSSLLNLLVGTEKAIVTSVAGTTRDILEESIKLQGIGLNIIDTAGIRFTEDEVEKIGVSKAKHYAKDADLIVYVVDASLALDKSDQEIIELIKDKKVIILLNKTDLESVITEAEIENAFEEKDVCNLCIIKTSTKDNIGIDCLEQTVKNMFFEGHLSFNDEIVITNARHAEALMEAEESLKLVRKSIQDNMPEDFFSIDLMSAYSSLGNIIGEEVGEDLVNEIFSKFCMGK